MKRTILYIISVIVIAMPWLFLLEVLPFPYNRISTALEITLECAMFAALLAVVILLRRENRRFRAIGKQEKTDDNSVAQAGSRTSRIIGRILFILAAVTLFVVGLILLLIAISFTL